MDRLGKVGLGAGSLVLGAGLLWRYSVRRGDFPCPSWLSWTLENPLVEAVAGSATLLDRADIHPGMKVLDAGCGPGRLTFPAAERVGPEGEVVALDVQTGMLRRVKERIHERRATNVRAYRAALGQAGLARERFDRVLLVTVLGEIPDRRAAMRELAGALKPGGLLSVTEVLPDPHYQRRPVVERLARKAGLRTAGFYPSFPAYTANFVKPAREGPEDRPEEAARGSLTPSSALAPS